jgi:tetratricopeptide (TPR) repeat protein
MILYIEMGSDLVYDAIYCRGLNYYQMGKYDEALKYLEEARKAYPDNETLNQIIDEIKNRKA